MNDNTGIICDWCNKEILGYPIIGLQDMHFDKNMKPSKRKREWICLKCNQHRLEFITRKRMNRK